MTHNTLRTTIAALSAAAITLGLAACGADKGETNAEGKPVVTIAISKNSLTKPMSEMKWPKQLEKACGCEIKWQEVSSDWDQKKQAMFASGNIPDMILKGTSLTDMGTYGSLFEDLSDDLDQMPNVKKLFDEDPGAKRAAQELDGKIHILPSIKKGFWGETAAHMYINKQWLDKLGLQVPTTWDELETVLKAFKTQDPNGNGQADEIPMDFVAPATTGFGNYQPTMLLGSLGVPTSYGGKSGYIVENGTVKSLFTDDRYKQLIEYFHKLWSEDLINKEAFTHDYSQMQSTARGDGDTAKVGLHFGWSAQDRFGATLSKQYVSIGQLKASANQSEPVMWDRAGDRLEYIVSALSISAKTKHKEQALKIANEFYDQDVSVQVLFGDIGPDVEKVDSNTYKILPPSDPSVDASTWHWTETIADDSPFWLRPNIKIEGYSDIENANKDAEVLKPALDNVDPVKDVLPSTLKFSNEDLSTIQLNDTNILNTAMTKFASWITKGGVENEWDDYVSSLKAANIDQNVKLYQKSYDSYYAN